MLNPKWIITYFASALECDTPILELILRETTSENSLFIWENLPEDFDPRISFQPLKDALIHARWKIILEFEHLISAVPRLPTKIGGLKKTVFEHENISISLDNHQERYYIGEGCGYHELVIDFKEDKTLESPNFKELVDQSRIGDIPRINQTQFRPIAFALSSNLYQKHLDCSSGNCQSVKCLDWQEHMRKTQWMESDKDL